MNGLNLTRRLKRLEKRLRPSAASTFTLEELCRSIWRDDQRAFRKLAGECNLGLLVRRFESEDAERRKQQSSRLSWPATDIGHYRLPHERYLWVVGTSTARTARSPEFGRSLHS